MSSSNYSDVLDQLQAAGLVVDHLEIGRIVRCRVEGDREKRGWYKLHELPVASGELLIVGTYGVWRGDDSGSTKIDLKRRGYELSAEQRDAMRRRLDEDRRRANAERKATNARAAARAQAAWLRYSEQGESEYLAAKGVQGYGVRYTSAGAVVVPLLDDAGRVHGLQFLRSHRQAEQAERPTKEFWPAGIAKKGHFHLLGSPDWIVLVAEGYATAASLHMATGFPVAVAFDAGNLMAVAEALRRRYRLAKILICADDDALQKCRRKECGARLLLADHPATCPSCGEPHGAENAGVANASAAALAVSGHWVLPRFSEAIEAKRREQYLATGRKRTDFNDLQDAEGLHAVRVQIDAQLSALKWSPAHARVSSSSAGEGDGGRLRPLQTVDELLSGFALVYGQGGAAFDRKRHMLISLSDMRDACIRRDIHRSWMESPNREIVRAEEVGFDPAETDQSITCNLWAGWPTTAQAGRCELLLDHLRYMCSTEQPVTSARLFDWVLKWVAYPIQHPGAKLRSCVVVHGPQGTGKNLFFEAVMQIYGRYGRILDQDALVDKHNDWASRKLFLIADEVVAQAHRFEVKNKLKTLITGTMLRINPKHIAAYDEANHVNLVFLSNEAMPVVLEEDDRRHCVIWTPQKHPREYYQALGREIENGGIAALHDYLLNLDLGDFDPNSEPPLTEAKNKLIELAQDSPIDFADQLIGGEIRGIEAMPGLTTKWYLVYCRWCATVGVKPASLKRFLNLIERKRGYPAIRKRYLDGQSVTKNPQSILMFGHASPEGVLETTWLGDQIRAMELSMEDHRQAA